MALAIGPAALLAYGLRLRSLGATLDGIGKRTGTRIAAAMLDAPEAAIDVDSPQDLRFADRLLRAADRHRRQGTE
jgi:GTP:adenosylcobinamide-phosphate guanylyltransferase